ncbi:MAG: DinB family protein [Gemmatimonadales bacterium]
MRTIAEDRTLSSLVERLQRLLPDTPRRWGTLTAGEMLCHLADTHESVLGTRIAPGPPPSGAPRPALQRMTRPVVKWMALYTAIPWPKGAKTRPGVDPKLHGTRPADFEQDRGRAIATLRRLAVAAPTTLTGRHFMFGPMSARDWHRWAYRHVTYHLRQFGL